MSSMERKRIKNWIMRSQVPAVGGMDPGSPLYASQTSPDVKIYTIVREGSGYNILVESLTGQGLELLSPGPVTSLDHILNAAALIRPLAMWYPLEFYEKWVEEHTDRLEEIGKDNPLSSLTAATRARRLKQVLAELRPPRDWFLLVSLIEPGDVVHAVDSRGAI